jgi:RimJ/RimL family protein N-acetyltransferase
MSPGKRVRLREKALGDVDKDYLWHKDPELARLDATYPTTLTFEEYKNEYPFQLKASKTSLRHIFAVETLEGQHIGNCAYYDIDEDAGEAELGVMIGERKYWDKGYGEDIVNTLLDHIFSQTRLKRIYLKTLESNKRAQNCFKRGRGLSSWRFSAGTGRGDKSHLPIDCHCGS